MPRMLRRVSLLIAVAGTVLGTPASASAATLTVDQGAAAGCSGGVCRTVADALAAAADGDTVSLKHTRTPYSEAPLVLTKRNVTIEAQPGGAIITSSEHDGGNAGPANRKRDRSRRRRGHAAQPLRQRPAQRRPRRARQRRGHDADEYVPVAGRGERDGQPGAGDRRRRPRNDDRDLLGRHQLPLGRRRSGGARRPGRARSSLVLQDSTVVSGARQGPAVALTGGDRTNDDDTKPVASRIVRGTLTAARAAADALLIRSATSVNQSVVVDSSTLSGGASGAGLAVMTDGGALPNTSSAGDVAVRLVHATIAGGAKGIAVAANADGPALPSANPAGNVTVAADRSIVKGSVTATNFAGSAPFGAPNTVKVDVSNSDAAITPSGTGADGATTISGAGNQNSTPGQLFIDPAARNFHLRLKRRRSTGPARSWPVKSEKDVDGDPRLTGPATDLGSDEFVNQPPVPVLKADRTTVTVGDTVTFDGAGSVDPEAAMGGSVSTFLWRFGDGSPDVSTATPTISHAYTCRRAPTRPGCSSWTLRARRARRSPPSRSPSSPPARTTASLRRSSSGRRRSGLSCGCTR